MKLFIHNTTERMLLKVTCELFPGNKSSFCSFLVKNQQHEIPNLKIQEEKKEMKMVNVQTPCILKAIFQYEGVTGSPWV